MKKLLVVLALGVGMVAVPQAGAEETWKGTISDSMCAAKHSAEKHGDKAADHATCVKKCVEGGGEYVFVSGNKIHKIANQSFAALKEHAGHEVMLTGEVKNEKIVVSKVEVPKAKKK